MLIKTDSLTKEQKQVSSNVDVEENNHQQQETVPEAQVAFSQPIGQIDDRRSTIEKHQNRETTPISAQSNQQDIISSRSNLTDSKNTSGKSKERATEQAPTDTLAPRVSTASDNDTETVPASKDQSPNDFVTIIHFNDCYNVEPGPESSGAAGFLTAVNQFRHLNPLILFSGDIISPSFMSTFTKGEQMIPVLNDIGVHCAVFGNHEFDFGVDNLIEFTKRTSFPWLLSNVIDKETSSQLGEGQIYHIIERGGVKFGLIGLIEEEWLSTLSTLDSSDVIYQDFVERGRQLAIELKAEPHNVDFVIALTHFRTPNDCRLADSVPEIDLILGGHDHDYEVLKRPNCYIIKSGTDFREFSFIKLKLNAQNKILLSQQAAHDKTRLESSTSGVRDLEATKEADGKARQSIISEMEIERISCVNFPPDVELKTKLEKFVSTIDEKMGKVLGQFNCDLDGRFSRIRKFETNLGNFVTDIMLASTHADLAILNSGTLRSDRIHPKGNFTMRDLFNILGYIDPISVLQASGYHIWQALENGVSQWPRLEGRFPQVSGCSFTFDPNKPAGNRIDPKSITIGDEPLVLEKKYRLTTKAYLASGKDGYDILKECETLVPGDESPDLTTSILNHFEAINIVKSNRRTHHRQSIICLSRSSLKKFLDSQQLEQSEHKTSTTSTKLDGNNNNNQAHLHHHYQNNSSFDKIEQRSFLNEARIIESQHEYHEELSADDDCDAIAAPATNISVFGEKQQQQQQSMLPPKTSTPIVGSTPPAPIITSQQLINGDVSSSSSTMRSHISPQPSFEARPRTKRIMSLYEIECEQCKLEPKVEGRIRILGVNA